MADLDKIAIPLILVMGRKKLNNKIAKPEIYYNPTAQRIWLSCNLLEILVYELGLVSASISLALPWKAQGISSSFHR